MIALIHVVACDQGTSEVDEMTDCEGAELFHPFCANCDSYETGLSLDNWCTWRGPSDTVHCCLPEYNWSCFCTKNPTDSLCS